MRNSQISAQDEEESKRVEQIKTSGKGSQSNSTSGPVRIRLVVTKQELKRILRNKTENENDAQYTSLEQLLSDMKLREKRVFEIEEKGRSISSWRPALESIPEDRSMK
ncbi:hypothetical protein VNO77_28640 [Canavalia gladiata]|uniref:Uncharacterized protein n=1 Tax=Canavalia gladiata TaxID=3824 RepID=A0AAN9KWA3_CANGL